MKYVLSFFILSLFIVSGCKNGESVERTYHPDGTLELEYSMKNGVLHGQYTLYYTNGRKEITVNYIDGLANGLYAAFYYKGTKKEETQYKNGKKEGASFLYDEFGNIHKEMFYVNDTLHGDYIEYYNLGETYILGHYKDGKRDGDWSFWERNGEKIGEARFHDGIGTVVTYHANGAIMTETPYADERREGWAKLYNTNGVLLEEILYEGDVEISRKTY